MKKVSVILIDDKVDLDKLDNIKLTAKPVKEDCALILEKGSYIYIEEGK